MNALEIKYIIKLVNKGSLRNYYIHRPFTCEKVFSYIVMFYVGLKLNSSIQYTIIYWPFAKGMVKARYYCMKNKTTMKTRFWVHSKNMNDNIFLHPLHPKFTSIWLLIIFEKNIVYHINRILEKYYVYSMLCYMHNYDQ